MWKKPFTDPHHEEVMASYFKYSAAWSGGIGVVDVSPDGWVGQRDPMIVVIGRK